jgi:ribonucleoside-diphosphate reductase alpha chain
MTARELLPDRRPHELRDFEFGGISYTAGIGHFGDGAIGEIFLNPAGTVGTDVEAHARDAAITASLRLQHGCPVDALRKALTRTGNGGPGSALSYILDQLAAEGTP